MFLLIPLEKNSFTFSYIFSCVVKSNFQASVRGNKGLPCFFFASLCDWSRKLAPLFNPIRCKSTTQNLVTRELLRHKQFSSLLSAFSPACCNILLSSDWLSSLLQFYSTTRNRKCSITDKRALTYLIRKLISRVPHDRLYEAASMARSHSSSASPSARSWDGKIILYLKWLSTRMHASWLTFRAEM